MEFNVIGIFEDVDILSKVHAKKQYEANMNMFQEKRYGMLSQLVEAEDKAEASKALCDGVTSAFKKFGKVRGGDLMNLNYFMIYYVFPSILLKEGEAAVEICDTLRDTWNAHFKSNINYTDYDTLMEGFQLKIFGIPVGKN